MSFTAGDRVTVRGERWVVQEATAFSDATLLRLASADDPSTRRCCTLLTPFDRPVATSRTSKLRVVTRRRWMRHLQAQLSELHAFGELRTATRAAIDILPFQLEPALAVVRGAASRMLLADEVGLGKTIQAGLVLAELRQRGWCERALIVTPAGLRQQWCEELRRRFDVRATVIDAGSLAALVESLPFDLNPWTIEPVTIASIDFVKQPEVLQGLGLHTWDVLIVDEAHRATVASQRYEAIDTIAKRARHVLLLTATPHAGDDRAYHALCAIGEAGKNDPILLFRRTRDLAGMPRSRRVHLLPVAQSPDGDDMHRLLSAYVAQLWTVARNSGTRDVQLVAMVLAKRAYSCARSLATSIQKRLAGLDRAAEEPSQATLPWSDGDSDEPPLPIAPAFDRKDDERAVLERLLDAAQRAQRDDRKMLALQRLVRRAREPLVIFTEYRDTLDAIADAIGSLRHVTLLHGGQTDQERRRSVETFIAGAADVLIATDAGSEGLNLHRNCRIVVNLELPWNPIRLEQRIGRIDRIGQTRTVHAINLLAEGTAERTVLAKLLQRLDRIRMSEIDIAACLIDGCEMPPRPIAVETRAATIDLRAEARAEANRIKHIRHVATVRSSLTDQVVPVAVRRAQAATLISFYRARLVTLAGRVVEDTLVPVCIRIDPPARRLTPTEACALASSFLAAFGRDLLSHARAHAERRASAISIDAAESIDRAITREHAIAAGMCDHGLPSVQAGLFDARSVKHRWAAEQHRQDIHAESEARTHLVEAAGNIRLAGDPELVMALISCCRG